MPKTSGGRSAVFALLLSLSLIPIGRAAAAESTGRLVELWSVAPDADVLVGRPIDVAATPGGTLHVLDGDLQCVHVFGPTGDARGTYGAEGSGPDEFRAATSVFRDADGSVVVVQPMPLRLVRFSETGTGLGDVAFDDGITGIRVVTRMESVGNRYVYEELQTILEAGSLGTALRLVSFDPEDGERTVLAEDRHDMTPGGTKQVHEGDSPAFVGRWCVTARGHVAFVDAFDAYEGRVVTVDGSPVGRIRREQIEARVRGEEELERIRTRQRERSRTETSRFVASPVARILGSVFAGPEGQTWWLRDPGPRAKGFTLILDRFDAEGTFLGTLRVEAPDDLRDRPLRMVGSDRLVALAVEKGAPSADDAPALLRVFRIESD